MSQVAASSNRKKYESGNPLQLALIRRFQRRVVELLEPHRFETVLDVGCGEGFLARVLLDAFPGIRLAGVDASEGAIEEARARCPEASFRVERVEALAEAGERYDLVVCSEVLEHLDEPREALASLAQLSKKYALLTVPWEPWFQLANFARGKYVGTLGNHPEHVQHWGLEGFVAEAGARFDRLHAETSFPWILYLGTPAARGER